MSGLASKSLKNSAVALIFYAINLILQFVSRKIFIEYLGEDLLGLNTTITSILQFLNIAELGIGSAVGYMLYKPIFEEDINVINDIVTLQGWLYKKIAGVIIAASVILMFFFPIIFEKIELPLWYVYATFVVLLFSSLLGYFANYRQIVLSADLKEYKIQYSYRAAMLVKLLLQIIFIMSYEYGYVWWLVLEVIFAVAASVILNIVIRVSYPGLKKSRLSGKELINKYPDVIVKTKQLFFHKIGGFALNRATPIVIYGLLTLELVAIYGNYMLIMAGVTSLITTIFSSLNAGVGNLVASRDKVRIMNVFNELFSVRFLITAVICFCVYRFTQPFIFLWMGKELMLDDDILLVFVLITFVNLNRLTADAFINAYGLFGDVWSPIIEAALNIGLSVWFGSLWGLKGILGGIFISLFLVIFCWKQFFLFKYGLKVPVIECVKVYIRHFIPLAVSYPVINFIYAKLFSQSIDGFFVWGAHTTGYALIATAVLAVLLLAFTSGMRFFMSRIRRVLKLV